jgi:hypothetical protein
VYRGRVDIDQGGCASCFGGVDMWLRRGTFLLTLILARNICYRDVDITIHNANRQKEVRGCCWRPTSSAVCLGPFATAAAYDIVGPMSVRRGRGGNLS